MSLGHESSGIITALGSGVTDLKVGDKVALEVGLPCESCRNCGEGRYNICGQMEFRSSAKAFPHFQGTLQEKINHPAKWCHKYFSRTSILCLVERRVANEWLSFRLPDNVSLDKGALLEPLSVAIHAVRRANLAPASTTLVFGAGAVGLLVAAMLHVTGSSKIVIADIDARRVEFATENGFADEGFVVPMKRGTNIVEKLAIAQETAKAAVERGVGEEGDLFDAVFECTGVESCLQAAIYVRSPFDPPPIILAR